MGRPEWILVAWLLVTPASASGVGNQSASTQGAGAARPELPADRGAGERGSPYARWSKGPPTDPSWFPLGVWLQEPHLAERYRALGMNTYVGLWQGPTDEQLDLLEAAGMRVVCGANPVSLARRDSEHIIAWMQVDEPENRAARGSGPRASVEHVLARYGRLRRRDPTRPVWMNLGQGVANEAWHGMGAPRSDYPRYVQGADILSFDVYPVTNIRKRDGENYLWYVAEGVRRLRSWAGPERPVWNVIETTRGPHATRRPTPIQMRAEVWLSLVAGSRGIVYFCHDFEEPRSSAALLGDVSMRRAVKRVNDEILALAPVLNGPTIDRRVRVESSDPDVPVSTLLKRQGAQLYLFAIVERNAGATALFSIEGVNLEEGANAVEVLGEDRHLPLARGRFRDAFGPYGLHVYRIDAPAPR